MYQMKKGGSSKSMKKYPGGGQIDPSAPKKQIPGFPKPPVMKKGGSTSFGMLSVKKGIDNNPKPTAADRIAGATMKKGGSVKMKMGGVVKSKKK
jgi:hypothetical protein